MRGLTTGPVGARSISNTVSRVPRLALAGIAVGMLALAGCATAPIPPTTDATHSDSAWRSWQGRMVVRQLTASAADGSVSTSFSTAFDLQGQPTKGWLRLLSPLGTTLATVNWSPAEARLQTPTQNQTYASLDDLMLAATGTSVPVATLFDWLDGHPTPVGGWSVDVSRHADGRYVATQLDAAARPITELRIVLDR